MTAQIAHLFIIHQNPQSYPHILILLYYAILIYRGLEPLLLTIAKMLMDDIFDTNALSARDQVSEWVKIKETIGDSVSGTFLGWWEVAPHDGFKAQIGIAIKTKEEKVVGVNVSDTSYMRGNILTTNIGDRIGLRYEGDKDTGQIQKAKIIKFYNPDRSKREKDGVKSEGSTPQAVPETKEKGDIPF